MLSVFDQMNTSKKKYQKYEYPPAVDPETFGGVDGVTWFCKICKFVVDRGWFSHHVCRCWSVLKKRRFDRDICDNHIKGGAHQSALEMKNSAEKDSMDRIAARGLVHDHSEAEIGAKRKRTNNTQSSGSASATAPAVAESGTEYDDEHTAASSEESNCASTLNKITEQSASQPTEPPVPSVSSFGLGTFGRDVSPTVQLVDCAQRTSNVGNHGSVDRHSSNGQSSPSTVPGTSDGFAAACDIFADAMQRFKGACEEYVCSAPVLVVREKLVELTEVCAEVEQSMHGFTEAYVTTRYIEVRGMD